MFLGPLRQAKNDDSALTVVAESRGQNPHPTVQKLDVVAPPARTRSSRLPNLDSRRRAMKKQNGKKAAANDNHVKVSERYSLGSIATVKRWLPLEFVQFVEKKGTVDAETLEKEPISAACRHGRGLWLPLFDASVFPPRDIPATIRFRNPEFLTLR
jgi:hypothetical protein